MNISNQGERRLSYKYRNQKSCGSEIKKGWMSEANSSIFILYIFKIQINIKRQQIP